DVFLDALAELQRGGLTPRALVVGAGSPADEARYRSTVETAGLGAGVQFHPPMPARQAFARARILVVPSRAESMPYIVLEAAAAGLPLIATRVGGIPEIVDAEDEPLVAPGDPAALAAAMRAALREPQALAAAAARRRER